MLEKTQNQFNKHMKTKLSFIVSLCFFIYSYRVNSQSITSAEIDILVEKTLKTFDVPGIAVAVVKDGKVIHAKGYGVRSLDTKQKVDEKYAAGSATGNTVKKAETKLTDLKSELSALKSKLTTRHQQLQQAAQPLKS